MRAGLAPVVAPMLAEAIMPRPTLPGFGLAPISATDRGVNNGARRCSASALLSPRSWFIVPALEQLSLRLALQRIERRAFAVGLDPLLRQPGFEAALHLVVQRPKDLHPELAVGGDDQPPQLPRARLHPSVEPAFQRLRRDADAGGQRLAADRPHRIDPLAQGGGD